MRTFITLLTSLSLLFSNALAQSSSVYFTGIITDVQAGIPVTIKYYSVDPSAAATILLRKGDPANLQTVGVLTDAAIGGEYTWTPSSELTSGTDYALQITQGSDVNYSEEFTIANSDAAEISSSAYDDYYDNASSSSVVVTSASPEATTTDERVIPTPYAAASTTSTTVVASAGSVATTSATSTITTASYGAYSQSFQLSSLGSQSSSLSSQLSSLGSQSSSLSSQLSSQSFSMASSYNASTTYTTTNSSTPISTTSAPITSTTTVPYDYGSNGTNSVVYATTIVTASGNSTVPGRNTTFVYATMTPTASQVLSNITTAGGSATLSATYSSGAGPATRTGMSAAGIFGGVLAVLLSL